MIWCRNFKCIHCDEDFGASDNGGKFTRCLLEEIIISKDLKCEDYMEGENERIQQ